MTVTLSKSVGIIIFKHKAITQYELLYWVLMHHSDHKDLLSDITF